MSFVLDGCLQADTHFITDLELCRVLLMNESRYPWLILVPRQAGITEIYQLDSTVRQQLWQESDQVSRVLLQRFQPDKLNIAALGNVVAQLHVHHVARFQQDASWPAPVWGRFPPQAYSEAAVASLREELLAALST